MQGANREKKLTIKGLNNLLTILEKKKKEANLAILQSPEVGKNGPFLFGSIPF